MSALFITLLSVVGAITYLVPVTWTARRLAGHLEYRSWKSDRARYRLITAEEFENYSDMWSAERVIGSFLASLVCLPLALLVVLQMERDGQWMVAPKHVRQQQELAKAEARIKALERELEVS